MSNLAMRKLWFFVFIMVTLPGYGQEGTIGDGLIDGPGLFSGEAGAFELLKSGNKQSENSGSGSSKPSTNTNAAAAKMTSSGISPNEVNSDEFALFKTWLLAKQENSAEYQEFKIWLRFLEYKRQTAEK